MTLHTPVLLQPATGDPDVTYSAQEYRQLINSLMAAGGIALDSQGCLGSGQLQVTQRGAGANFSVDISPGRAFILGDDIASQGQYMVWNDATFNLATPGAPASGTRTHRVVAQVRDKLANGSFTTYDWQFALLQDTGTGEPAEPASSITLAHVSIAAGQASVTNANITDARPQLGQAFESFTPSLNNGGSATWLQRDGFYYRIGKLIFTRMFFAVNAAGSGSTALTLTGPPPVIDRGGASDRQILMFSDTSGGTGRMGVVTANAGGSGNVWDTIYIIPAGGGAMVQMTGANINTGGFYTIEGWYKEA